MKKAVVDFEITGHHLEYLAHILNFKQKNSDVIFIVNPTFKSVFERKYYKLPEEVKSRIFEISPNEFDRINGKNLYLNSINQFRLIKSYHQKIGFDYLIALNFNKLFLAVPLSFKFNFKIRGIIFGLQYPRIKANSVAAFFKKLRKKVTFSLIISKKQIDKLFILNDQKTVGYLNDAHKAAKFVTLPDPVFLIEPEKEFDLRSFYQIEKNKKIFLLIGSISKRKGAHILLDALINNNYTSYSNSVFLFCGKFDAGFKSYVKSKIQLLPPDVKVVLDDTFFHINRMYSIISQSDIILLPYLNPENSSGIIGHAIRAGKIIIGPQTSLLGEILDAYPLGQTSKINDKEIAAKIDAAYSLKHENSTLKEVSDFIESYLFTNSPASFVKTLIGSE